MHRPDSIQLRQFRRTWIGTKIVCMVVLIVALAALQRGNAANPGTTDARTLRVATGQIPPFVLKQGDQLTGFSLDLWTALARRLNMDFQLVEMGLHSEREQLQSVQRGEADVALSAIAMTAEREALVDFTVPYFDSGLQIMVRNQHKNPFLTAIEALFSRAIGQLLGAGVVITILLANVLWFVERGANPYFQKGYLPGILEGLWGVMLIIATGEHGDREKSSLIKRLTVTLMWLFGVVLIAQFTATVTSSLTVQQLQSSIQGPGDLPGKLIATVPGSTAAEYLRTQDLPYVNVANADIGYTMLVQEQVQAIVYDAPTLQYWAAKRGKGVLQVVGAIFRPEKYGIAVAPGSPLRKKINEALLAMYADGSYEDIYGKWFSQGK
jgi:polar amino acid transport system substrate-binding protein